MDDGEEYIIPLQDQRVFGAGIKRKRVQFVPAATDSSQPALPPTTTRNAGQRYLSIVLGGAANKTEDTADARAKLDFPTPEPQVCKICHLALPETSNEESKPHETSLVHQICLEHSHPPSHLDRNHVGLRYLSSHGWDPDSRLGLGAKGDGVRVPIKGKVKNDTIGLGVERVVRKGEAVPKKVERLDAKGMRRKEMEGKKRGERLQRMFYGDDNLEKYLGIEE